ncbi:MAG: hypothetical protein WED07_15135 [Candidatus Freyarchaeum deiterrae]
MEELKITKTGIPFLDSLLGGGLLGYIVTISQQPGVKFWELIHRILYNNYNEKFYLILATFHLSLQEYQDRVKYSTSNPKSLEEINKILSTGKLSVIDCFGIHDEETNSEKDSIHYVSNPFNVDNLLSIMSDVREKIPEDKQVYWYFPDITNMSIGTPEEDLVKFCRRAFRYHKQQGDLAIYILNEKAHSEEFFAKLYQLSDVFIKLVAKENKWGLENVVQVIKGPFQIQSKKAFYDVKENLEIQFRKNELKSVPQTLLPNSLSEIRPSEGARHKVDSELIRTKIPILDSLLGGGIPPNSIVVSSYHQGVMIVEPVMYMLQDQLGEKNHVIIINYPFSIQQFATYLKIMEKRFLQTFPSKSFLHDNLTIIDCLNVQQHQTDTPKNNVYTVSNPFDVDKLLSAMTDVRNSIPENRKVFWAFYSLTEMSIGVHEDELIKFCRRAFRYHKWCGDQALYILNEQAHSEIFLSKLYQLSDVFIKFIAEDTRKGIDTFIQILKSPLKYDQAKVKFLLDRKGRLPSG